MTDINILSILDQQRPFARWIAAQMHVVPDISPEDMLFDFLVRANLSDPSKAVDVYFSSGRDCAARFAAVCREHLPSDPKTVLEFASGYGRVGRHVRHILPATSWACCDVHPTAVEFNTACIGLESFISAALPEDWVVERKSEVVFALSFFSHMPDTTFAPWLRRLFEAVEPGGILVFTTHGMVSLRNMKAGGLDAHFNEEGFYWNPVSDQLDLDSNNYGTSAVTLDFVQRALQSAPQAELIRFQQAFWWAHQDLYVVRKPASGR